MGTDKKEEQQQEAKKKGNPAAFTIGMRGKRAGKICIGGMLSEGTYPQPGTNWPNGNRAAVNYPVYRIERGIEPLISVSMVTVN